MEETSRTGNTAGTNAWCAVLHETAEFDGFAVRVAVGEHEPCAAEPGDGVVIVEGVSGTVIAFGRVLRRRRELGNASLFLDSLVRPSTQISAETVGLSAAEGSPGLRRIDWSTFLTAVETTLQDGFGGLPLIGEEPGAQMYLRELLQTAVTDDLLGPAAGPYEEIVEMSVRDRYLVGKLAPRETRVGAENVEELADDAGSGAEEGDREREASTTQSLVPSSIGLTFCVDGSAGKLEVCAEWGRYERRESELHVDERTEKPLRAWKRIPAGGSTVLELREGTVEPVVLDPDCPDVTVHGTIRATLESGDRLVTLFLVNTQKKPDENQDAAWVFQPELLVRSPDGEAIFNRRPVLDDSGDDASSDDLRERAALEMLYRKQVEFAVGHGISVHAETASDREDSAVSVRTRVFPQYEVPITETPGKAEGDRPAMRKLAEDGWLDMEALAGMERERIVEGLTILTEDYSAWIGEQRARIGADVVEHDGAASEAMDRCEAILERLREGAEVLARDDRALEAFRLANRAMALQRVHGLYALRRRRGEDPDLDALNVPGNRTWRPFQLAFILLSVPALADPTHRDRTERLEAHADLLWFPTGGGKTEAYLGVAAFTMGIRRLQGDLGGFDGTRGLAVIMRYTLRLLTLQQFQRATTLICALETIRREAPGTWGNEPFTIGLWVGQKVTPNTTEDSHQAIEREREGKLLSGSTPAQFNHCPWCGCEIASGRDIQVDRTAKRTFIYCGDKKGRCEFSRAKSRDAGLPVSVVDDEIYRRPPSMMIATVDKFAMMTWRGQVRTLFGKATRECPRHGLLWPEADCSGNHQKRGGLPATKVRDIAPMRPPDLIIQDEFHLISGPLGTMVGLYESAVDDLSSWRLDDQTVRPKIVASTATVRKAPEQVHNVFLRRVSIFPASGLDIEDNFFSVQRPISHSPGRRYFGVCAPGSSRPAVLIRVYVAMLTAASELFNRFGKAADPYMTLAGYFNSLRELGGMRRLAEDDVQARAFRVLHMKNARPGMAQRSVNEIDELTSRVQSRDIPRKLDGLEVEHKASYEKGETRAMDIVLATNMLSVGVDVSRLGMMVVNGQPKNTAEYIQATSRVGRASPGLICTVLNWARPRDLSHYETFEHYHSTFYKHVEAQSVTPFAPRALDRGLTGTIVSLIRLPNEELSPNTGAEKLQDTTMPEVEPARDALAQRAWLVTDKKAVRDRVKAMVSSRIDRWVKEAVKGGRRLGYESKKGQGDMVNLLKKPGIDAWDEVTAPMSMREVEPAVRLIMDDTWISGAPAWTAKPTDEKSGSTE